MGFAVSAPPCPNQTFEDDVSLEKGQPDKTYTLDWLDEDAIQNWWDRYKQENNWKLLTSNCCKIVYEALVSGGAPTEVKLVWTPGGIDTYVGQILENR